MKKSYRQHPYSLASYQALRHQKQQLAMSQTDSIQVRFHNFQELLKVSSVNKICNKYISKSALELQSDVKQQPVVQQQLDTQDIVLKKFDKMVDGIEKYDEENCNKAKKNLKSQQTQVVPQPRVRKTANNRIKSAINANFLNFTQKKTQKQYHDMLSLKHSMAKNQLFLKIPHYEFSNRTTKFQNLKNRVQQLEKKAKKKYGLIFANKTPVIDQEYQQEMQQIQKKQLHINSLYVKNNQSNQYQQIIEDIQIESKIEDSSIPRKLLMDYRKQKKSVTRDCIRKYAFPQRGHKHSNTKRYIKIL